MLNSIKFNFLINLFFILIVLLMNEFFLPQTIFDYFLELLKFKNILMIMKLYGILNIG